MSARLTLQELLPELAQFGDLPAVISFGGSSMQTLTFAELEDRAMRLAGGLLARGVGRGEPVALFAPNRPQWVVARLALIATGATAVLLDDLLSEEELSRAIADSGSRRIFTTQKHVAALRSIAEAQLEVIVLEGRERAPDGTRSWETLLGERPASLPESSPDDIAALFYTSGTTGPPKGVPLTHANILSTLDALLALRLVKPRDRALVPLPLHHAYPFIVGMLVLLASGSAMVLPAGVSGPEIIRALREGEVTAIVGVPRLYEALYAGIEGRVRALGRPAAFAFRALLAASIHLRRHSRLRLGRLLFRGIHREFGPHLRLLASGGARLDPELCWRLEGLGWEVLGGYGLVETTSASTFNARGRVRMESVGLPAPGCEVRIDRPNEEGRGEILIRGPNVFAGYRNNPEANREAFTEDGWFRSGDLGFLDEDGYLHFAGRVKEMIVLPDGKNVAPEEVEAVYAESPYVREIAVLERNGALAGLVVPELEAVRQARSSRIGDLVRVTFGELSPRLPPYKRLSGFAMTRQTLPRTNLGKYRRHLLPEIYERAERGEGPPAAPLSQEDRALLEVPRVQKVWRWLEGRFPNRKINLETSPQLDLGIDSLAWVELSMELERRVGVRLSEEQIARVLTLGDLLREVGTAPETEETERAEWADLLARMIPDMEWWLGPIGPGLTALGWVLYGTGWLLARALFRLRVQGVERVPSSGPLIVAANHVSDLDPFIIGAALPYRHLRQAYWGADTERVFGTPLRLLGRVAHLFPVDDRAPRASLAMAMETLERGKILIWFPEEWRSPTGELQRFLPGVGMLLKRSGASVVPAYIRGTFEAMPRHRRVPRLKPVSVVFGQPFAAADLEAAGEGEDPHTRIANALHDAVAGLGGGRAV
ncbi:MAG: AMP-binding protein [Alphaproteobacteria bacterium]